MDGPTSASKKEDVIAGHFEVETRSDGQFMFNLKLGSKTIHTSEVYTTKAACPEASANVAQFPRAACRGTTPDGPGARHRTVSIVRGQTNMATVIREGTDQSGNNVTLIAVVAILVIGLLVLMFFFFNGYMGGPQVINMMQRAPVQEAPGTPGMPGPAGAPGAGGDAGAPGAPGSTETTP